MNLFIIHGYILSWWNMSRWDWEILFSNTQCTNKCWEILYSTLNHIVKGCYVINDTHWRLEVNHYSDIIMSVMVSQITCVSIVCSTLCSGADQRKHQISVSLAFVRGIHQWLVDSPHKGSITQKKLPLDDTIMISNFVVSSVVADGLTNWWSI